MEKSKSSGIWDMHAFYKTYAKKPLPRYLYCQICSDFNQRVSDKVIKESFEFKIPFGLGYLRIRKNKLEIKIKDGKLVKDNLLPDWTSTRKLWSQLYPGKSFEEIKQIPNKKLIYFTNEHTDGYVMKWYWDKRITSFKNQSVYSIKPVKGGVNKNGYYTGRRGLAKWIKDPFRTNEYYK